MTRKPDGSIIISDLSIAEPNSALADMPKKDCWYKMDYELMDGTRGVMLTADPVFKAEEITIPLNVSGVYKVFIGVNYFFQYYETNPYGSLWLKLSGDHGFSRIGMERYCMQAEGKYPAKIRPEKKTKESYNTIYETYWRTAELSGKSITINIPKPPYDREYYRELTNISFIRLEPASPEDVEFNEELKPRAETKNMGVIWCGGALSGHTKGHRMYHPKDSQWFKDDFEAYKNSDFGIFCMEAIRGNVCLFKTKHGEVGTWDKSWGEGWVDPLAEFTRLAHENDMKMFVSMRMMGAGRPYAFNPINWGRFFWENRQWAKKDKDGNMCSNLSLAYEGTRNHWLSLLREALGYGIDGIHLHLNRCAPFVMYEEPVVNSFIEKYGVDPRAVPEVGIQWDDKVGAFVDKSGASDELIQKVQKHAAEYVTQFIREIRALLDEKPGRELSIIFKGGPKFQPGIITNQCDADTWIEEGLVNYLLLDHSTNKKYIRYWKDMAGDKVKLYYSLMPRTQPGEAYVKLAESLYEQGADGFSVWDCERRIQRASEWNVLKHLGHRELFKELEDRAPHYYRYNSIKFLRGVNVKYSYRDG